MEWANNGGEPYDPRASANSTSMGHQANRPGPSSEDIQIGPTVECNADVRVLAQSVDISHISFVEESFRVHTEITIIPLLPDITVIPLHIGQYALLPSEVPHDKIGKVTVNGYEATYDRRFPFYNSFRGSNNGNMQDLFRCFGSNMRNDDSQLHIIIPSEVCTKSKLMSSLVVCVDVLVKRPKTGVQFAYSHGRDGAMEKGAHVFTYRSALLSATHEWLPCLDAPDQLALWRLSITCDANCTAVTSAELLDVVFTADMKKKVYQYQQAVPTSACNMGWAVGNFVTFGHPDITEVTSFCLPGLTSLMKHTVSPLDKILEYFEELLSCRYPFPSYKQVFVDKAPDQVTSYSSLTIFSVNVLFHKKVIDVVQETRAHIAVGVAQQFFSCFIGPTHWLEWWVPKSLARLISSLYIEKVFGNSEFMYQIKKYMSEVIDYESQWGKIYLRSQNNNVQRTNLHCDPRFEQTCSPLYAEASWKKGLLTLRMLLKRIGQEPFFQVLHKILTVGHQCSERRDKPASWSHLVLSTDSFFRTVTSVTGNEIPTFVEQWICAGGHASFQLQYTFNRKRNMIELEVKQDVNEGNGRLRYLGPLIVVVQELDGSFQHTVQIDGDVSRSDLQCHSKGRRQKRKKVPLYTGEEVEVDLSNMDPDSPVLWIRADPEHLLLRQLLIRQPIYQWEYMLKYERDVIAQLTALDHVQQFPSAQSRAVLLEIIAGDHFFYRVRCKAAYSLSAVLNRMTEAWSGQPDLIDMFKKQYGSKSCSQIPRPNNFVATSQNLQHYFLMQALPQAAANMRNQAGSCLSEVKDFIIDLIKFNDNSTNRYSDDHYRAALLKALSNTIVPSPNLSSTLSPGELSADTVKALQELTLALNMDTLKPSYGKIVGITALNGIYALQRNNYIPHDSKIFWMFAAPKICVQMRIAALTIIVDRIANVKEKSVHDDLEKILSMAERDHDPAVRIFIPYQLTQVPPFRTSNNSDYTTANPCNTVQVADLIFRLIHKSEDIRAKMLFADLYFSLYGLAVPPVKGGPAVAPGHHRLYTGSSAVSGFLSSTLDDDRPDSPLRNQDSLMEDMLQ
ncbi:unnamed protein product [Auanema sp. JU1783]|nr:unnamed protein product [Auanema sp. JU1783]